VRVDDSADFREGAVKHQMRRRVRTRLQIAFHHLAIGERDDNHVLRFHVGVGDAARFDDNHAALSVHAAGVAPGLDDQTFGYQIQIGLADFGF